MTGLDERLSGCRGAAVGCRGRSGGRRRSQGYSPVANSVRAAGRWGLGVELDTTNSESHAAIEAAIEQFGGLHILVETD